MKKVIVVFGIVIILFFCVTNVIINAKNDEKINVLVYGVDNGKEAERSDSIMLVNVNFNKMEINVTSIPRDSYVKISCKNNKYDKINHSYAYGGERCLNETVSNLFDIKDLYNVMLGFEDVEDIVNYFEKVELTPNYTFCQSDEKLKKNYCFEKNKKINIDGKQALAYMRNRKSLPNGDITRASNQRQIFKIVLQKIINLGLIDKIKFFNYAKKSVSTNIEFKKINYKNLINMKQIKLNEYTLKGKDYYNRAYYYKLDNKYLEKIKKIYI